MDNTTILETSDLTHDYGDGVGAIDISLKVNPGEIVGFIGPNGAGKTTTMRMIMGFISAHSGHYSLFGNKINTEADLISAMPSIGFLPAETKYYNGFNGIKLLKYVDSFYKDDTFSYGKELANRLHLDLKKKVSNLSTGNQRKLGVVLSMMHKPELVILDEPTSGLDPLVQQTVLEMLDDVEERGGAVFLSSHVLTEVEQVCDRIVMIKEGKIILQDSTDSILAKALRRFKIRDLNQKLKQQIEKLDTVDSVKDQGIDTLIYVTETKEALEFLLKNGITEFYLEKPNLEEMFLHQYA